MGVAIIRSNIYSEFIGYIQEIWNDCYGDKEGQISGTSEEIAVQRRSKDHYRPQA